MQKKESYSSNCEKKTNKQTHTHIQTSKYHKNLCALWSKGEGWIEFKEQGKLVKMEHAIKKGSKTDGLIKHTHKQ